MSKLKIKKPRTSATIKNKARIASKHNKKHPNDVQIVGTVPIYVRKI